MKIANKMAIGLAMIAFGGCMHQERPAGTGQGGAYTPDSGTGVTRVSQPQEAEQPLSNVERVDQLIGQDVLTSDHLRTGKIDDFVIDEASGRILYAVVGLGGVLGVAETRVAVAPTLFTEAKKGMVQVNVDKHKLANAPKVPRDVAKTTNADFVNNVYGYYGQKIAWQGAAPTPGATFNGARCTSDLIGMKVQNQAHQDIGKVQNLILDVPAGHEMYVIISPSSDMNLGNNLYALPPGALSFSSDQKTLVTDITREKLSNGPHFAKNDWSEISNMTWEHKVYDFYGQAQAYPRSSLQPTGRTDQPAGQAPEKH